MKLLNVWGRLVVAALVFVAACGSAYALKMAPDTPVDVFSANKKFVVHAVPSEGNYGGAGAGKSTIYEVKGSERKLLWTVDYFSRAVLVSNDGAHMAMLGASRVKPYHAADREKYMAIAFYSKGKLIKEYSVQDLIPEPTKEMRDLILGGNWMTWRKTDGMLVHDKVNVELADGTVRYFDIKSGTAVDKKEQAVR